MYASNTGTTSVCLDCNDTLLTEDRASHTCGPDPVLLAAVKDDVVIYCSGCAEPHDTDNDLCARCRTLDRDTVREWLSESLIDSQGMIQIGSLTYEPIRVLKSVDPIAYREMFDDFADSLARDGYIIQGYNDN